MNLHFRDMWYFLEKTTTIYFALVLMLANYSTADKKF